MVEKEAEWIGAWGLRKDKFSGFYFYHICSSPGTEEDGNSTGLMGTDKISPTRSMLSVTKRPGNGQVC
jgi:hypothetical protein